MHQQQSDHAGHFQYIRNTVDARLLMDSILRASRGVCRGVLDDRTVAVGSTLDCLTNTACLEQLRRFFAGLRQVCRCNTAPCLKLLHLFGPARRESDRVGLSPRARLSTLPH